MDSFNILIQKHFNISLHFLVIGLLFGLIYSINLLGFSIDSTVLNPSNMRTLHISLMLYGFIPLMLSYLPFLLIHKEIGSSPKGLHYLNLYTIFWYVFLVFMISSLLFGNSRGLAFYDFAYELNFILAFAGIFYAFALYEFIKQYSKIPTWVKVCLSAVIIAPVALLILMNPTIGQVESSVSGPHGDNTLGMSLSLIPLYYLIIKLLNKEPFIARWNILWIIPMLFYCASVLYRSFYAPLTYNQEWFLQYLTLLYVPLLYRWYQDAKIKPHTKKALLISILAFLFVDIQGNILFIPQIRWLFHRNDLIIAHAHVAMGIGVFFMVVAMFVPYLKSLKNSRFYPLYLASLLGIFISLSLNGFVQAGFLHWDTSVLWSARSLFGLLAFLSFFSLMPLPKRVSLEQKYHLLGMLTDGLGGVFLIMFAGFLYPLLGFEFSGKYEYIVFMFVCCTGIIHCFAFIHAVHRAILTQLTLIIRVLVASVFFALFYNHTLGIEALGIALFDLLFASYYLVFLSQTSKQKP